MLSREEFIIISLEINLFFQRIMKEHLFFIETSLQPVEADRMAEANALKQSFEHLLAETVFYANGVITEESIRSNSFVTPYTLSGRNKFHVDRCQHKHQHNQGGNGAKRHFPVWQGD